MVHLTLVKSIPIYRGVFSFGNYIPIGNLNRLAKSDEDILLFIITYRDLLARNSPIDTICAPVLETVTKMILRSGYRDAFVKATYAEKSRF